MNFAHFFNLAAVMAVIVGISILTVGSLTLVSSWLAEMCVKLETLREKGEMSTVASVHTLRRSLAQYYIRLFVCQLLMLPMLIYVVFIFVIFAVDGTGNLLINKSINSEFADWVLRSATKYVALEAVYGFIALYVIVIVVSVVMFFGKIASVRNVEFDVQRVD